MSVLCLLIASVQVRASFLEDVLYPNIKDLSFCSSKALSHGEGWVSTRQWDVLAENCCGKLHSRLDVPRVKAALLMKDILISHLGPQSLWRWLKSCQPRVSVGAMQFSIWDYSFSVNAFPCHWYLIFHSFSSSDVPSVLTDVAVRAYRDVHPLPPRSIWWSSEADSLPELHKKMNRSSPTAKSQVHKQAPVQRCSHGLNRAYSHKLESQLQSCSCLSLVTHFNFTLVNVKIICYLKKRSFYCPSCMQDLIFVVVLWDFQCISNFFSNKQQCYRDYLCSTCVLAFILHMVAWPAWKYSAIPPPIYKYFSHPVIEPKQYQVTCMMPSSL